MKPSITFRRARAAEQRALEDLQRRASLVWDEDRDWLIAHPDAIELPMAQITDGRVLVAERDISAAGVNAGVTIGFAVVLHRDDHDAELDGLFVEPAAWRQGIGRALVAASISLALDDGASNVWVVANSRALDFYLACGFVAVGEVQTQFRPALQMRKIIRIGNESMPHIPI